MKTMIRNKYNVERNHSQSNNHLNQSKDYNAPHFLDRKK